MVRSILVTLPVTVGFGLAWVLLKNAFDLPWLGDAALFAAMVSVPGLLLFRVDERRRHGRPPRIGRP